MNEEQKTILRMLSEGKITAEEAEQLMEAIGKPTPRVEPKVRIQDEEEPISSRRGSDIQAKIEAKIAAKMEKAREKMARKQEKVQRKMEEMHCKMERKGFHVPEPPFVDVRGIVDGAMKSVSESLRGVSEGMEGMCGKEGDAATQAVEISEGAEVILSVGGGDAMVQGTDETILRIQGDAQQCQVSESDNQVKVSAGGTDVRVSVPKSVGSVRASVGGGDLSMEGLPAPLEVTIGGGDLSVRNVGSVKAKVEGGDAHVSGISGNVEVQTVAGDIEVRMDKITERTIRLTAEEGRANLWVDPASAFDLTMEPVGQDLDVHTDLPLEIVERSERHLKARLNGGGAQIALSSGEEGFVGIWGSGKEESETV